MYDREYKNSRFLIVEGDVNLRLDMVRMLKKFGAWLIELASNASDAIDKCRAKEFDVVICDYSLSGRNGQNVLEELREHKILRFTSTFIMMSSKTTKEMVLSAIDHQPDAYINKSIKTEELKVRLDNLLLENESLYDIKHAMDVENWAGAIASCEEKIAKRSKYRRWCEKTVARLYHDMEAYDEALRVYKNVLEDRPLVWAQIGIVRIYMVQDKYEQAENLLSRVIEISPYCLLAYDLLTEVLRKLDKLDEAQDIMMKAVSLSPSAILRHSKLGELCRDNDDIEASTEAFRNAVELGKHSIYDSADNHIGLARGLCDKATAQPQQKRDQTIQDAMAVLKSADEVFQLDDFQRFEQNIISAKSQQMLDDEGSALTSLTEAKQLYDKLSDKISVNSCLDYAQILFSSGRDEEAESVLSQVEYAHGDNEKLMKRVGELRDDPVGPSARLKTTELNKRCIKLAQNDEMHSAFEVLLEAVGYSPRHPSLNLNLIQVSLKLLKSGNDEEDYYQVCADGFERLVGLASSHKQYPRYKSLKKEFDAISS